MEVSETYLAVRWSTSRGRDTYGYNICSVTDQVTSKRYSCNGGGYDMLGTSFGEWLTETYQNALHEIGDRAYVTYYDQDTDPNRYNDDGLYGMYRYADGRISLDGACGIESMLKIAKALGIGVHATWDRKGHTTGYIITGA